LWFATEVLALQQNQDRRKPISANGKLQIGVIGCGDRVRSDDLLYGLMRRDEVEIVACCDVDEKQLDYTCRVLAGEKLSRDLDPCRRPVPTGEKDSTRKRNFHPKRFRDFRELVENGNVDAVLVVTPDHWHALAAIAAAKAKKDIYCEKPLSLTIAEGRAMADAARANLVVFQTGSQQRSQLGKFRLACELVRNGRIGKLKRIETRIGNPDVSNKPFPTEPVPEGLDWNFWLGQTSDVPFTKQRCHYQFRWWYAYSGGKMTDWGAHHNDIAQWALDMDNSGPIKVTAIKGEQPHVKNAYDCHRNFEIVFEYANGVPLHCLANGENGVHFQGENGWIFVSRGALKASDPRLINEPLGSDAIRLRASASHMGDWLKCIKTRERCCADVEIGHRSATVCHLGNIALRFAMGKTLEWDPSTERFSDTGMNQHLSREMRAPWKLA